jgi:transcriptional regulator with XRE-family HTH domain
MATDGFKPLGMVIRELRTERGITGNVLAQEAGLSPAYLSDIELSKRLPPPETIHHIAVALNIGPQSLLWRWFCHHVGKRMAREAAAYAGYED